MVSLKKKTTMNRTLVSHFTLNYCIFERIKRLAGAVLLMERLSFEFQRDKLKNSVGLLVKLGGLKNSSECG